MAQTDLRAGDELLGYRVERIVGRGGMGVVYLAHQLVLDRMVALKLLAPELAGNAEFRQRFLRESRLAASLDHPNIVPVFDAGEVEGRLYIAMRFVEGRDLGVLLAEESPLEPGRATALLAPVADALDAAQAKGLVHRDVKPSNVLVDESERPYLADFGLTKESSEKGLVEQSHFAASVEYVAPEQIEGNPVDGRADQYALACVLYEALTGSSPYADGSTMATLWGHLDGEPPRASERNSDLPGEIDAVFERALAKNPEDRYPTCSDFTDAAGEALGLERTPRLLRPRWLAALAAALALVVAAAVLGAVLAFGGGGESGPKPDLAVRQDSVLRIDPETNEISAVVDVGRIPTGIAVGGDTVWVVNLDDTTVSAIDAGSNSVIETYAVTGRPPFTGSSRYAIAADDEGAWVVTADGLDHGVLTRLQREPVLPVEYELDYEPFGVAVGEGWVWVTAKNSLGNGHLLRIDPETGEVDTVIETKTPHQPALVGDGAIWTVTEVGRAPQTELPRFAITRIDPVTLGQTAAQNVEREPYGSNAPFVSIAGGAVWVHQPEHQRVLILDAQTLRQIETKPLTPSDWAATDVAEGDDALWWNADGRIRRLDPETREVHAEITWPEVTPRDFNDNPPVPVRVAVGAGGVWVPISWKAGGF